MIYTEEEPALSMRYEISDSGTYLLSLEGFDLTGDRGMLCVCSSGKENFQCLIAAIIESFKGILKDVKEENETGSH